MLNIITTFSFFGRASQGTLAGVEAGIRQPLDHPELRFPLPSFHSGADNTGWRQITQEPPHLSFGRFLAGSTFLICGLPDSFSWLSALSPAVAMEVRELALRSLQTKQRTCKENWTARGGRLAQYDWFTHRLVREPRLRKASLWMTLILFLLRSLWTHTAYQEWKRLAFKVLCLRAYVRSSARWLMCATRMTHSKRRDERPWKVSLSIWWIRLCWKFLWRIKSYYSTDCKAWAQLKTRVHIYKYIYTHILYVRYLFIFIFCIGFRYKYMVISWSFVLWWP